MVLAFVSSKYNMNLAEEKNDIVANAVQLIEKYGNNLFFIKGTDKKLEDKRILSPIAIRDNSLSPYKYGLINNNFEVVVNPIYDVIVDDVLSNNQLIRVGKTVPVVYESSEDSDVGEIHLKERYGVVDTEGRTILDTIFDNIYFSDNFNLIIVSNGPTNMHQGAGLFERSGKEIIPVGSFYKIYGYNKGLARVIKKNKWGIINTEGKLLLPTVYDNIWSFERNDFDSIIVEKNGVKSHISITDIFSGKYINNNNPDDLPF